MDTITGGSALDVFFGPTTMSVHFKDGNAIFKKEGKPGDWKSIHQDKVVSHQELIQLIDKLYKEIEERDDAFLEIDKTLSKVIQLGPYRIVIVYPPLSDGLEMTVVKPTKRLTLSDYNLDEKILHMLKHDARGILVSGSPGSGKTTFAQAIADLYVSMNKVIKTLESPRDLMVPNDVVQYSFSYGSHDELRDILLLSRPDFTVYDEVRNKEDFELYKDLRLTGIGLIGVIHATRAVDAIQRFIGTIELGIISQVIDTVIYIKDGGISDIYQLSLKVKVPTGMQSEDLSRPVIEVTNFFTDAIEFEIYTYGEQVVVIPLSDVQTPGGGDRAKSLQFADRYLQNFFDNYFHFDTIAHVGADNALQLYLPAAKKGGVIGKGGENISGLEQKLGLSINVKTFAELPVSSVTASLEIGKKKSYAIIGYTKDFAGQTVSLVSGKKVVTEKVGVDGRISLHDKSFIRSIEKEGFDSVFHVQL